MPAYANAGPSGSVTLRAVTTFMLLAGAALAAASGAIHLHLWADGYRTIPTIGPLFLFQGVAGVVLAVVLAASRRLLPALATAGFMISTIGGFLLSVYVGLFGFSDTLAAPWAGVSLTVEIAGVVVLAGGSALLLWGAAHR
jgi:xanthine/uracil permease